MTEYQKRQLVAGDAVIGSITLDEPIEVVQDTAADLKATVTQAAIARTVTGSASVTQDNPAALKATVSQASSLRDCKGSTDGGTTWVPIKVDANGQIFTS